MTALTTKYPRAADVKWETETEDSRKLYETEFKMADKKVEAFWEETGAFVREEAD